eukprot:gene31971-41470_t
METKKKHNFFLLEALRVPCDERERKDLQHIVQFIEGLKIFSVFNGHADSFYHTASKLKLVTFSAGSYVFQEGEPGYDFFIILDGEVCITRKKVVLITLSNRQYFGEYALENKNGLRSATVIATQDTQLLALHADDYQHIFASFKAAQRVAIMAALSSKICIFHKWNQEKLSTIAEKVLIRNFNAGATIFKAGDRLSALMLIKSGIVRLVKALPQLVSMSSPRTPREKGILKVKAKSPRYIAEAPKGNSSKESPARSQLQTPLIITMNDFSPRPPPSPRSSKGKGAGSGRMHVGDWNPPPTAIMPGTANSNERSSAPHTIDGIDAFPSPSGSHNSPRERFRPNKPQSPPSPVIISTANSSSSTAADSAISTATTTSRATPARGTWLLDKDMNELYTTTCFQKYGNRLSRAGGRINRFDLLMAHDKHRTAEAPPKSGDKHPESPFVVAELLSGQTFGEISVLTIRPTTAAAALAAAERKFVGGEGVAASSEETESTGNPIFIRGEPIAAVTAICCTAVELYCLDSDMLISLGIRDDHQICDALLEDLKYCCPPDEEVLLFFQEKAKWEHAKANIMKSIKS